MTRGSVDIAREYDTDDLLDRRSEIMIYALSKSKMGPRNILLAGNRGLANVLPRCGR